jgi:hypothetical protein
VLSHGYCVSDDGAVEALLLLLLVPAPVLSHGYCVSDDGAAEALHLREIKYIQQTSTQSPRLFVQYGLQ